MLTSNIVGPIDWTNWYVMGTLYRSLKDPRPDQNGLTLRERQTAYTEIKRQFICG